MCKKRIATKEEKKRVCDVLIAAFYAKTGKWRYKTAKFKFSITQLGWYSFLPDYMVKRILSEMKDKGMVEYKIKQGTSSKKSFTMFNFTGNFKLPEKYEDIIYQLIENQTYERYRYVLKTTEKIKDELSNNIFDMDFSTKMNKLLKYWEMEEEIPNISKKFDDLKKKTIT